jgi:hypothetical protein
MVPLVVVLVHPHGTIGCRLWVLVGYSNFLRGPRWKHNLAIHSILELDPS